MEKKNAIFRNEFDYLITDTIPAEMPAPFSFSPFYRWLTNDSSNYGEQMREAIKDLANENIFPGIKYGSFPHRFEVKKKNNESRLLSCPSILGATLMMSFIMHYQKEVLYDFSKISFSIRKHKANSSLMYVGVNGRGRKKLIHYISDFNSIENELMERTGMFFDIRPIHNLSSLWKSTLWSNSWNRFHGEKCLHADIENCFPSIYTHTLGWVFPHEGAESKGFNKSNDYHNSLDRVVQKTNANETHGIPVGPEFSRLAAETLLEEIDRGVILELENKYKIDLDYSVLRFVDDYYIFGKNSEIRNEVLSCIEEKCKSFFLRINKNKVEEISTNNNPDWILAISLSLKHYDVITKGANASTGRKFFAQNVSYYFQTLLETIKIYKDNNINSIVPYVLTSFFRKFKSKKECKRLFDLRCVTFSFYEKLFGFLFDVCGNAARFYNIQTLSLIINNIVLFSPSDKKKYAKSALEKTLHKSDVQKWVTELIERQGIYDVLPLLFEFSNLSVLIPKTLTQQLFSLLSNSNDPVAIACGIQIFDKIGKINYKKKLIGIVENRIDNLCSSFYLSKHFETAFLSQDFWYIYIFNRSADIQAKTQTAINDLIKKIKSVFLGPKPSIISLICDYMLDSNYKLFDWDFFSIKSQRKWHYVTNKRTNLIKGDFYR